MKTRDSKTPFTIFDRRAMISLGPLSESRYCPFSCAFCYVQNGFLSYSRLSLESICDFLKDNENQFDIVYVSGDTDSFAEPRNEVGVNLLNEISLNFDKDLLFTTRALLSHSEITRLVEIDSRLKARGKRLYACISISCPYDCRDIEPIPIPTVEERIELLSSLKNNGIVAILAMRPFLPIFHFNDYKRIIEKVIGKVDLILGERWYYDKQEIIYNRVMGSKKIDRGISCDEAMDFNDNDKIWSVWVDSELEKELENLCTSHAMPFYMRSAPAIKYLREHL